jgi:hypothetical protein
MCTFCETDECSDETTWLIRTAATHRGLYRAFCSRPLRSGRNPRTRDEDEPVLTNADWVGYAVRRSSPREERARVAYVTGAREDAGVQSDVAVSCRRGVRPC